MILYQELERAQAPVGDGRIWRDWQAGLPGPVTLKAIHRVIPGVYHGPAFDAVWMVLALQAALPGRFAYRGKVGIGAAAAQSANEHRVQKIVTAARQGRRETLLNTLVEIAKTTRPHAGAVRLGMKNWVEDTANALSGDPDKVATVCRRWTVEYSMDINKQLDSDQGEEEEEMADAHA